MSEAVRYETAGGVATLTMDQPESRNALTPALIDGLWDGLDSAQQRALLTAIATVIENHEMPPHRYVMLHPQARLSSDEVVQVIEWTRAERSRLRASPAVLDTK